MKDEMGIKSPPPGSMAVDSLLCVPEIKPSHLEKEENVPIPLERSQKRVELLPKVL